MPEFIIAVRAIVPASEGGPMPWREIDRKPRGEQAVEVMMLAEKDWPGDRFEMSVFPSDAFPSKRAGRAHGAEKRMASMHERFR